MGRQQSQISSEQSTPSRFGTAMTRRSFDARSPGLVLPSGEWWRSDGEDPRSDRVRRDRDRRAGRCRTHLIRGEIRRPSRAWPLGEGAVMADIPATMGERDENLARIGDMAAMPLIAQTSREIDQLRGLFEPDKEGVIARIAHRDHL
jgi:hypothetical protein